MAEPTLSILLPARNAAHTLPAALTSLLADLGPRPAQLVAVDDRSTDGTRAVLDAFARDEPRLKVVEGPGNGVVGAIQAGLTHVTGELIARMDADDVWLPGRLDAQLAALAADATLAGVGGEVEIFCEPGPPTAGMKRYEAWINSHHTPDELHRERYVEAPLCQPTVIFRRAALDRIGGYRHGLFPEDYELWLRCFLRGERLATVPRVVLRWRDSTTRLTRTDPRYAMPAHRALKAAYLAQEPFFGLPLTILGAGETGLPLARALLEKGAVLARFIEVNPRKVGTRLLGVPVVGYDGLGPPSPETHLLVAVGARGARAQIRAYLLERGFIEGTHFTCVA